MIRLKTNQRLQRVAKEFEQAILFESEIDPYEGHHVFYRVFTYKPASWIKSQSNVETGKASRRIIIYPNVVVTTLTDRRTLYSFTRIWVKWKTILKTRNLALHSVE